MEFETKKCGVLVLKRGIVVPSEGVEMPDAERIIEIEKDGYRYLGILEYNKIKESKNEGQLSERISEQNKINHEK